MKTCSSCKFYGHEMVHEEKKYGFCFRYPPTALADNKSCAPVVRSDLRECGEYKPKAVKRK